MKLFAFPPIWTPSGKLFLRVGVNEVGEESDSPHIQIGSKERMRNPEQILRVVIILYPTPRVWFDFSSSVIWILNSPKYVCLWYLFTEAQKPKTFQIAVFHAPFFSGRNPHIHFSRHIKKRVNVSYSIPKSAYLSLATYNVSYYLPCVVLTVRIV